MNRIETKDLDVGQLVWYIEYGGDAQPNIQTLVKVLKTGAEPSVLNVLTGEAFEAYPIYTYFESVHPQYVELRLKALRAEHQRLAAEISLFESL